MSVCSVDIKKISFYLRFLYFGSHAEKDRVFEKIRIFFSRSLPGPKRLLLVHESESISHYYWYENQRISSFSMKKKQLKARKHEPTTILQL